MAASPETTDRRWTPQQWDGISAVGSNLLVSAAAGSGKTAVLAERCAYLVCDASPPCAVDELLVVTFTEAAAAEMKDRIQRALRRRLAQAFSPRLAQQVALVERASVSTLHGFCARLLRQHFHVLGLDPNFLILDGDEADLLRDEVAHDLFFDRYERDDTGDFQRLIDSFGDGDDERLMRQIVRTHELLNSVVDPEGWRQEARRRIAESCEMALEKTALGRELLEQIDRRLGAQLGRAQSALDTIGAMPGFGKYIPCLEECLQILHEWRRMLREDGLDALAEVAKDLEFPRLPSIPNASPGKELAYALVTAVRDDLKKGALADCLQFSATEWREGLRSILPHVDVFLNLVGEFAQRYQQAKRAIRSLDFSDLERFTLQVLRDDKAGALKPSVTARMFHRQFQHVLVDEYQDINAVQDAILTLLSRECVQQERHVTPNLFCVGDVKQSIYRFRLAEPGRFLERQKRFREKQGRGRVIDLQKNFRSRSPLLEALNRIFARLMTEPAAEIDYDQSHWLHPGATYPPAETGDCFSGAPIELHLLSKSAVHVENEAEEESGIATPDADRTALEATLLVQRIRSLMGMDGQPRKLVADKDAAGQPILRPLRYGDIVILLRSLRFKADQFAEVLRRGGIPVHSDSGCGYFNSMEVRDVLALLQLLDNQRQDIPLAAVLRSPLAAIPSPDDALAQIRLASQSAEEPALFHLAVTQYAQSQNDELAARLRDFLNQLAHWRKLAHSRPLAEVLWAILEQTGYLAFCLGLADGEQRAANLLHLHERARQFGSFQRQGLYRFLRFLENLEAQKDIAQPSTASEADDVVRIMSIHGSKGLEFPVVLLPDLGKRHNLSDCRGPILVDRQGYLGMAVVDETRRIRYPSLALMLVQDRIKRQSLAEELRLLYVAMTRAREHLILVGTIADSAWDKWISRWSGFTGPLPAEDVLGGSSQLDWIGPVAAASEGIAPAVFQVFRHTTEEIATWPNPEQMRPQFSPVQQAMARLQPLPAAPPAHVEAEQLIARLTAKYPHEAMTTLAAVQSVTGWTKGATPTVTPMAGPAFTASLPMPRCLSETQPSAADRGTATHLLLQYLDFTRPCTPEDTRQQIEELLTCKAICAADAELVDLDSVQWLLASEIGQLIRDHARELRREQTLYLARAWEGVESHDPLDQVMIRGRLDLLIPHPSGWVLVDYKTDRVTGPALDARVDLYQGQVDLYRQAVEQITHRPVAAAYLVFLAARQIRQVG